jgi:hypothetical protein
VEDLVRSGAVLQSEALVLERAVRTGDRETVARVLGLMEDRAALADDIGDHQAAYAIRQGRLVLAGETGIALTPTGGIAGPPIAAVPPVGATAQPAMTPEQIRQAAVTDTATMLGGPQLEIPAEPVPAEPAIGTWANPAFEPVPQSTPGDLSHLLPNLQTWAADESLDVGARRFMEGMIHDIQANAVTPAVLERYVR